jgi:hypothetical protein
MKTYRLVLTVVVAIGLLLLGCTASPAKINAALGQEVSLAIGQQVSVAAENLEIKFLEVVSDSRCPTGVYCPWQGQVSCLVQVTKANISSPPYKMVLTQPGLTEEYAKETFDGHEISFSVMPYPVAGKSIPTADYRLQLIVNRLK